MRIRSVLPYAWMLLGSSLYALVTWKWNVPAAAWLAPLFLMRFFRTRRAWPATLPAIMLIYLASFLNKYGVWDMDPAMQALVPAVAALPLMAGLYLDRWATGRLPALAGSLVFPAVYVCLDALVGQIPQLGVVFTLAPGQFGFEPLLQLLAISGMWGVAFLVLWAAPLANLLWERGWSGMGVRRPVILYATCLALALVAGGLRQVWLRPAAATVRVAGVTVAHPRNYWDEIIDRGTPHDRVQIYETEMRALEDRLFAESEKAARSGAKIIFWSEADAFLLPGEKEIFLARARDFARREQVYFLPAYLALKEGQASGFNGLALITPQGELAYEYEKTKSWYATTSDGIIHSLATPYGRIGAAICFDMDFPDLARQAARQGVDIMLVPAFDSYGARLYHSEVGMLRSVESGFSMFRMVNEGTSMAVDYRGHLLAWQDFFTTPTPTLIADLPVRGVPTLYGRLGDWLPWACALLAAALVFLSARTTRAA